MKITVKQGQGLFDIAIQYYGDVEGALNLILNNDLRGFNSRLKGGQILKIPDEAINKALVQQLADAGIVPATQETIQMGAGNVPIIGGDFNNDFNNDFA